MNPSNKPAIRAATCIHAQLAENPRQNRQFYLPEHAWNNIQQLRRQIDVARQRG